MKCPESLRFLAADEVWQIRDQYGSPIYVYDEATLRARAHQALRFSGPFGLTVRYALKANPTAAILRLFDGLGLHFDASSGFEAHRAMMAGIPPEKISLSAQQMPADFAELAKQGVMFVATSLSQLDRWGRAFPGSEVAVRFNPGIGSGHSNRTNVGGPNASFGIWHESKHHVQKILNEHNVRMNRVHTHIGSGADPAVWDDAVRRSLSLVQFFDSVQTLDLGGGFKVARMQHEVGVDLGTVSTNVGACLEQFANQTGRQIALEIEPGTFLTAEAGALIGTVEDIVDTGSAGHNFIKTDTGMTEILRPAMYGAEHPIVVVPKQGVASREEYVIVGHCCESGDILSPHRGDPETIARRILCSAQLGDAIVLEGVGAYCSAMAATNYNSFPKAPELLRRAAGDYKLIRRRQTLQEIVALELPD